MYAMFPVEWKYTDDPEDGFSGSPVDDAGTIYFVREYEDVWPESIDEEGLVLLKTTIAEMIKGCLAGWDDGGYTAGYYVQTSNALAAALRSAADMLDARNPSSK